MFFLREILPKMVRYRLARAGLARPGTPLNLTFSVTNMCQSSCRTCRIWELYKKNPERRSNELAIDEIEKIFQSMGHVYIFNVSGGEPFMRPDLKEIVSLACRHLTPGVIHIPTNAIAVDRVEREVGNILRIIEAHDSSIQLTVKPSLDHVGERHDEIRGVPGNFDKVVDLFGRLKAMQPDHPGLHVELGTVISRWNVEDVEEIARFVRDLGADSYRNEIAEQRSEMFNSEDCITPAAEEYERAINYFVGQIRGHMKDRVLFQRITNAFRLTYYGIALRILKENKQVIPCYAGISNAHMSPYGDIWACCTLGYDRSMGNLREYEFDFKSLWNSRRAREVRSYVHTRKCNCPLANQAYSNILLHVPSLVRVLRKIVFCK